MQQLYGLGPEAVTLALMAATRQIAALRAQGAPSATAVHPSTPSGQIPVDAKPNAPPRRRSRRGAKNGHPGHHRDQPLDIHRRLEHRCRVCPECGGPLQRCERRRTRIIEDLPEGIHAEVTEHTIWRDYCPRCKKDVEPVVGDAWSKATFGHRLVCYYLIDRGRGSPVLKKFFDTVFEGVLLPDFWAAYNAVEAAVSRVSVNTWRSILQGTVFASRCGVSGLRP